MSFKYLSDEWFAEIENIRNSLGTIEVPAALQGLAINIVITDGANGEINMCLNEGMLERGHQADAPTTMTLPQDLAFRIFVENDTSAGMQGFMSGQIAMTGDMSRVMALQMVEPSEGQKQLQTRIIDMTSR